MDIYPPVPIKISILLFLIKNIDFIIEIKKLIKITGILNGFTLNLGDSIIL